MKNQTPKPYLLLALFCLLSFNVYAQTRKHKKPLKTTTNNAVQHTLDSLSKVTKANGTKIDSANRVATKAAAKADSATKTAKANQDKLDKIGNSTDTIGISRYIGKTYIFSQNYRLNECGQSGFSVPHPTHPQATRGDKFLITGSSGKSLIILFYIWDVKKESQQNMTILKNMTERRMISLNELDTSQKNAINNDPKKFFVQSDAMFKRGALNFKSFWYEQRAPNTTSIDSLDGNRYYFLLPLDSLKKYTTPFVQPKYWDITFGTLITPFKLRFRKFAFSDNLSVGGALYYQRKMKRDTDFMWGFVGAISLSSVTLDQSSVNLPGSTLYTTSTTRPAFSPSLSYVISYKNINCILGIGFDFISKPINPATNTNPEAGWIYNGKPWLGIGIGVSLFNSNSSKSNAVKPSNSQGDSTSGSE